MRCSTVAVFFLVVVIASVLAAPAKEKEATKKGKKLTTKDETKSNKLSVKKTETKPMSLREPRSFGYVGQPSDVGVPNPRPETAGYWPKYRIIRRGRDDDEDDDVEESDEDVDDDDIQDDEGGASDEDDEEVSFDTPDWNVLFPKEESGPYDYAWRKYPASTSGGDVKEKPLVIGTRGDGTSYALAPGSPGGGPRGRTTYVQRRRPSWGKVEWSGRRSGSGRPIRRRQPVMWAVKKAPKSSEEDSPWTQAPVWMSERPSRRTQQGPIYYKTKYVPSSNRRNWNWRPAVRRQAWDSDEDVESGEEPSSRPPVKVVWARQQRRSTPNTMKRSRNWGRQPWAWGESWN
jgi:hypothetical protein